MLKNKEKKAKLLAKAKKLLATGLTIYEAAKELKVKKAEIEEAETGE